MTLGTPESAQLGVTLLMGVFIILIPAAQKSVSKAHPVTTMTDRQTE